MTQGKEVYGEEMQRWVERESELVSNLHAGVTVFKILNKTTTTTKRPDKRNGDRVAARFNCRLIRFLSECERFFVLSYKGARERERENERERDQPVSQTE